METTGINQCEYRVIYADTDQMGVVYYGRYLSLFERGRNELLREMGHSYDQMEKMGLMLPVRRAWLQYEQPARYDDLLTLETRFVALKGARLEIASRVLRGETLLAHGGTEHYIVDAQLRPIRPPAWLRELLLVG